jgi:outer membrane murein-binding lipoprotein Lpp
MGNKDIILKKQEEDIQRRVNELTEKQSEIRELNIDKQKLENDLDGTRSQNQALKSKLEESLKSLESNANMI